MTEQISVLDDLGQVSALTPQGPSRAASTTTVVAAAVLAVDVSRREVQVRIYDAALWLPAQPGRYLVGAGDGGFGLARVLIDPIAGRPVLVLGAVNPRPQFLQGSMTASGATTATVTVEGVTYALPYLVGTYGSLPRTVWVSTDDWGVPVLIQGPTAVAAPPPPPPTPPIVPPSGGTVQATATIAPQWSDTWRTSRSMWGAWNAGTGLLFQGNGYGSGGTVVGLATYGDQAPNLGASSIDKAVLRVWRGAGGANAPASLTIQGTSAGSQPGGAPAPSGTAVTLPAVGVGGWAEAELPADVREALRTGAIKSFAAVGGTYSGWGGALTAGSMVLHLTISRPA